MKIAVATLSKRTNSQIADNAGRAPYYIVFGEEGEYLESMSNPFHIGGGGAGFGVAKMLADKGVSIVVAGKLGANMKAALISRGLEFQERKGVAQEVALEILKK